MRQTIDIPPNREVTVRLVVPETVPCGKRDVILEFPTDPASKADELKPDTPESLPKQDFVYPPGFDSRLIGAVNPELLGTVKIVGDIIGPFHDEWDNGY
jgi:hypothetical protein